MCSAVSPTLFLVVFLWSICLTSSPLICYATEDNCGHESDSSGEGTNPKNGEAKGKKTHSKRFLQLYTSKAYCNQRSKLVQPHDNDNDNNSSTGQGSPPGSPNSKPSGSPSSSRELAIRRSDSAVSQELDEEHVLSPRIVEAVTHSTQVVWANCQKTEGLLGKSDIKLQTAIGMPVGVDESGNVWVVVMFSPKNVESTSDAIEYLQYISRSAASTSIPCLLPVVGGAPPMPGAASMPGGAGGSGGTKMICDGSANETELNGKHQNGHAQHSLVSIKPKSKQQEHTQELGDGVTAKFVSFNINGDDDDEKKDESKSPGGTHRHSNSLTLENDLRNAPKDDWGIPMLPETAEMGNSNSNSQQTLDLVAIDNAITDAFDEASYGVWSTIMNSAGGEPIRTSESIATKMHLIQERLEDFATAFLGMSVFDVADAWTVSSSSGEASNPVLKCLFTAAATESNLEINALREISGNASINIADGAVGKAYSSGYPVWSSVKELIYDSSRKGSLENCKIETAFAVPIFSTGDVSPSCVLSCYSLLPTESVPFVLNFVQKAVRLLWSGLDRIVDPHESVGKELWKDVGPADLGEMAADVEMQKAFIGKKRPRGASFADDERGNSLLDDGRKNSLLLDRDGRDRSESLVTQMNDLPSLAPAAAQQSPAVESPYINMPISAPPAGKGLAPAPQFPNTVQERSPNAQFVFLGSGNDGHWAVQQAVQSVGGVQLWNNDNNNSNAGTNAAANIGALHDNFMASQQQHHQQPVPVQPMHQQQQYQPVQQPQHHLQQPPPQHPQQYQMSYVNYSPTPVTTAQPAHPQPPPVVPYLSAGVHTDDPATIHANLMEFNAMAQMHTNPNNQIAATAPAAPMTPHGMSPAPSLPNPNGVQHMNRVPNPPTLANVTNNNAGRISLDKMVVIPISQAESSVILTGPQQSMYCTSAVSTQNMDPSLFVVDQKPCRIEGCNGFAVSKRPYCATHCGNRQCERVGCSKCAQGATRFCIAHGGGRRCTFPGCDKGARDKYFCAAHGGGKRCKKDGCSKSAVGGSNFCTGHGGGKRCQVPGCDKSAQSSTKFCVKHGGGKKCQHHGCEKVARGRTLYCAAHGGGVRCKLQGCNRVAIGKAQLCRAHGGGANSHFNAAAI